MKIATTEKIIKFGLEKAKELEEIPLSAADFLLVYRTMQELIRFTHTRDHYKSIDDFEAFLDTRKSGGMFKVLSEITYKVLDKYIPPAMEEMIEQDAFSIAAFPKYYKASEHKSTYEGFYAGLEKVFSPDKIRKDLGDYVALETQESVPITSVHEVTGVERESSFQARN